jgi:hypothetical protein
MFAALAACNWGTFDDLQDSTWVHAQKAPDGVGSSDYAVALVNATDSMHPGALAVLGATDTTYSVLDFDAKGKVSAGFNTALADSQAEIAQLPAQPVFVSDGAGNVGLAQTGTAGFGVVFGSGSGPTFDIFTNVPGVATAATYAGTSFIVAAGSQLVAIDTTVPTPIPTICDATDSSSAAITGIAALAADASSLYAWTTDGRLVSFTLPIAAPTCTANATTFSSPASFMPAQGSRIFISGTHAVLAGHDGSGAGQVFVADLTATGATAAPVLTVESLVAETFGPMGTSAEAILALGYPARSVNGVTSGQVELYKYDMASATLDPSIVETLESAQPGNDQQFGRDLGVMKLNGFGVLAVAAKGELYTYFRTTEYPDDTRQH